LPAAPAGDGRRTSELFISLDDRIRDLIYKSQLENSFDKAKRAIQASVAPRLRQLGSQLLCQAAERSAARH